MCHSIVVCNCTQGQEIIPKSIFRKAHNAVIALAEIHAECDVSLLLIFVDTK